MKTAPNASIQSHIASDLLSWGQQAMDATRLEQLQTAHAAARARGNSLSRSRAALIGYQVDDGFRPFRVF